MNVRYGSTGKSEKLRGWERKNLRKTKAAERKMANGKKEK